jgi:hypothetical protein
VDSPVGPTPWMRGGESWDGPGLRLGTELSAAGDCHVSMAERFRGRKLVTVSPQIETDSSRLAHFEGGP